MNVYAQESYGEPLQNATRSTLADQRKRQLAAMDEPDRLAFLRRDADRKRDAYKEKRRLEAESLRRAALLPNLQGQQRRPTSGTPGNTRMASSHHGETRCIASTLRRGDCLQLSAVRSFAGLLKPSRASPAHKPLRGRGRPGAQQNLNPEHPPRDGGTPRAAALCSFYIFR